MSDEKMIKIGVVGAGSRGVNCFATTFNARDDARVVALCDVNATRVKAAVKELGDESINTYGTVDAMCDAETLDAVVVTSPDKFHDEHAVAALNKGVNVLLDKPLATTVKGCKRIIEAGERSGKTVMIGFNLRHTLTLRKLKEIVAQGTLGRVFLIENREYYNGGRTYMSRWNRKYDVSGGLWIHKGSHDFDVFNWLLDFPRPKTVSATAGVNVLTREHIPFELTPGTDVGPTCSKCAYKDTCPDYYKIAENPKWNAAAQAEDGYAKDLCMYTSDKDVHDNGIAIVEYENGVRCSHLECFITSFTDRQYTLVGDRGMAEVSLHDRTILVRPRWSAETILHQIPPAEGGHGGSDPDLVSSFVKVIKGGTPCSSTAEHGMLSTAIGQAAEISWRENRIVQVDELLEG